jgi:hypothetical protein
MPDKIIQFLGEGNVEVVLMKFLGIPAERAANISGIAKAMKNQQEFFDKIIVGMVDNDAKNVPSYFDEFKVVNDENNIHKKKHKDNKHYLLVICPEMEKWLLQLASDNEILIQNFGLPTTPKELHKITSSENLRNNSDFRDFLMAIQNTAPIQTLRQWLKDLKMDNI